MVLRLFGLKGTVANPTGPKVVAPDYGLDVPIPLVARVRPKVKPVSRKSPKPSRKSKARPKKVRAKR